MTTRLEKPIRREIELDGKAYTVAIDPEGVKLTEKGRRNGVRLEWKAMANGDAAIAAALVASNR